MSWIVSPAEAEAFRRTVSLTGSDTDGARRAVSNGTNMPDASFEDGCGKAQQTPRRSGTTRRPSTRSPGTGSSPDASPVFHASRSVSADAAKPTKTKEICGLMSHEFFGELDRSDGVSWKMSAVFVPLIISAKSSPTWKPSGLMLSGRLAKLPAWARTIGAQDCGFTPGDAWPTPTQWPTRPNEGNVRILRQKVKDGKMSLEEARVMLNGKNPFDSQANLPSEMLPTPCARDYKGKSGLKNQPSLPNAVEMLPTPCASYHKGVGPLDGKSHRAQVARRHLPGIVQELEQASGSLSADWVEWLMGWIPGWTKLEKMPPEGLGIFDAKMIDGTWWTDEPKIPRLLPAKEQSNRVDRLKMLGNGMVPLCMAVAFMDLKENADRIQAHYADRD